MLFLATRTSEKYAMMECWGCMRVGRKNKKTEVLAARGTGTRPEYCRVKSTTDDGCRVQKGVFLPPPLQQHVLHINRESRTPTASSAFLNIFKLHTHGRSELQTTNQPQARHTRSRGQQKDAQRRRVTPPPPHSHLSVSYGTAATPIIVPFAVGEPYASPRRLPLFRALPAPEPLQSLLIADLGGAFAGKTEARGVQETGDFFYFTNNQKLPLSLCVCLSRGHPSTALLGIRLQELVP